MPARVLIVEDEFLVGLHLKSQLEELGYETLGIAPDAATAFDLVEQAPDIALVDVHLRDGVTGPDVGSRLAREHGVSVVFVTANPRMLGESVPGALGVLPKPCTEDAISAAVEFAVKHRLGLPAAPPDGLQLFLGDTPEA